MFRRLHGELLLRAVEVLALARQPDRLVAVCPANSRR